MAFANFKVFLLAASFAALFDISSGIMCYQCSAAKSIECSDMMVHMDGIQPMNCDSVFEAQYCIKSTSLDEGIGAKRFCSSVDLGNYCNYVRQPGDIMTYRSCVFTCTADGCNSSRHSSTNFEYLLITNILLYLCNGIVS